MTFIIKPGNISFGEPGADWGPDAAPARSPLHIEELDDRYLISPVSHRGTVYEVARSKQYLEQNRLLAQDGWVHRLQGSEWSLVGAPLQYRILLTLYEGRGGPHSGLIEQVRQDVRWDYGSPKGHFQTVTGTRILYTPSGIDTVIHDIGSPHEYSIEAKITGPSVLLLLGLDYEPVTDALVEERDISRLWDVFDWVSGRSNVYLDRLSEAPTVVDARCLTFGSMLETISIITADGLLDVAGGPARGVHLRELSPGEIGRRSR